MATLAIVATAPLFGATPAELKARIEANVGDPFLQRDREDDIRELAGLNNVDAVRVMIPLLADPFEHIRERTILEARKLSDPAVIKTLAVEGTHKSQPHEVRVNACEVFERMARPDIKAGLVAAMPALLEAMDDRDPRVAAAAVRAVVAIAEAIPEVMDEDARELFVDLANKGKDVARPAAIVGCAKLGLFDQIKRPEKLVGDKDSMVKVAVLDAAALLRHRMLYEWIQEALDDKRDEIARMAALQNIHVALEMGHEEALQDIMHALAEDDDWRVRQTAIDACIECWRGDLLAPLVERIEEEEGRLRHDVIKALRLMTGDDRGTDHEAWKMLVNTYVPLGTRELGTEIERGEYGEWPADNATEEEIDPNATTAMFFQLPIFSDRVMFVFDFSGSMRDAADSDDESSPRKIDIAKREFKATLDALPVKARYNVFIYRYYSTHPTNRARTPPDCIEVQRAFPTLVPANARGKAVGHQFIDNAEPLGWGNFYGALSTAFEDADIDTIYFLADGRPSRGRHCEEEEIYRALVRDNRFRRIAVNTVLTGAVGADEEFMQMIGQITWGSSSISLK